MHRSDRKKSNSFRGRYTYKLKIGVQPSRCRYLHLFNSKGETMQNNPRPINEAKRAKLEDALKIIRDGASETKDELQDLLNDKYQDVRTWLEDAGDESSAKVRSFAKRGAKAARGAAKDVSESIHENPWAYVGGAALVGLAVGYLITSRGFNGRNSQ